MKEKLNKIGKGIWTLLNSKIFFIALAVVLGFFFMRSCNGTKELERQKVISDQNYEAALDTITLKETKNGELIADIDGYIKSEKDLINEKTTLSEKLKDNEGKLLTANRAVFSLKQDTTTLRSKIRSLEKQLGERQKNDSTWVMEWAMKYMYDSLNYDYVEGETTVGVSIISRLNSESLLVKDYTLKHLDTRLLARETQMELTFGQRVVDGKLNIFLQTDYPGFSPSVMEGTFIDPNTNPYVKSLMKKKQFLPNTWNVGLGATVGYDFLHLQPAVVVGVNVTYSLFQW